MTKKDLTAQSTYLTKAIGRAIAKRRQSASLTQEQVAEKLKVNYEAVSRMERGIVVPTVERLIELATIFDCQAADFLTETSHRPSDQAQHLTQLLAKLGEDDRQMIVGMVEQWVTRLGKE